MSVDWPEFQLGDRCVVKSSKRIFAREYVDQGVPFMRSKDVIDKAMGSFAGYDLFISDERFSEIQKTHGSPARGDLLMSSVGNRSGQPYVVQDEGDFHFKDGNILWLSEFDNINSDYLAYWLKSEMGQGALTSVMIGSAQKALTIESIRNLWVRFPSIEYQNSAANVLLSLDKKIQINRQTNQTLEHIAQTLFKSWFVDFEPTRAKIAAKQAGQDPERAAMAAISGKTVAELDQLDAAQLEQLKTTAALFPNGLVESELGEVPEGWGLKNVGDIVKRLKPKKRYTKKQVEAFGKTPVYEQGASILLGYHNDDAGFEATPEAPIFIFGDHTCVLHLSCEEFDISQNVIPLTGDEYPTIWVYYAVLGKQAFQEYRRHWSEFVIKDVMVCCPMLAEEFARRVTVLYEYKEQYVRESKTLEQLRDTLLPKLLSGELSPTQTEVA